MSAAGTALINKLQSAIADAAALDAVISAGVIDFPKHNQVLQKTGNVATFKVTWRGAGTGVRLKQGATVIAESATGDFVNVPPGWYQAVLMNGSVEGDGINVGVGDVYVVAGQSNAVSPLQPAGYVPARPSGAGKVIISDYYGQGMHSFVDSFNAPFTSPSFGGVAWIACGMALNRAYPVMFVIIAKGNTSAHDWAYLYGGRIYFAWANYNPRAILWHQGESECTTPPAADSYTMLNAIVESLRQVAMTPWVIALNSTSAPPPAGYNSWPVRSAQQQVVANWPHTRQGPDTDTIRTPGEPEFLGAALQSHGQLWAASLAALGL